MGTPGLGPVWVLCWRYPVLSETIVPTEVAELIRQGVDATLVPLQRPEGTTESFDIPDERILRPHPWPSSRASQLSMLVAVAVANPSGTVRLARRLRQASSEDRRGALVTAACVAKAAAGLARPLHVHAHFAGHLARAAALLSAYFGCTWSTTAHAKEIYTEPTTLAADFRDASFVRAISIHGRDWVARHAGLPVERVPLIHCGVDTAALQPDGEAPGAGADGPLRLVSVGRLVPKKGHELLVRAVSDLRTEGRAVECDIVGEGPEEDAIRALVRELGMDGVVRLHTGVRREPMLRMVSAADAIVMASRKTADRDWEGIPLALVEAMALGRPVVAGDVGGTAELVEGVGILFDGETADSLSAAISRLADLKSAERAEMGARCRARVEEAFSLSKNVARLKTELEGAASAAPRRA
jgi:glycosyltransferase involved in cell wall biosynthesis